MLTLGVADLLRLTILAGLLSTLYFFSFTNFLSSASLPGSITISGLLQRFISALITLTRVLLINEIYNNENFTLSLLVLGIRFFYMRMLAADPRALLEKRERVQTLYLRKMESISFSKATFHLKCHRNHSEI